MSNHSTQGVGNGVGGKQEISRDRPIFIYLILFCHLINDTVTEYTKIHKMARIKAQRNHDQGFYNVGFLY